MIDLEAKVLRVVKFMGWTEDGDEHLTILTLAQEIRNQTVEEMEKRDGRIEDKDDARKALEESLE